MSNIYVNNIGNASGTTAMTINGSGKTTISQGLLYGTNPHLIAYASYTFAFSSGSWVELGSGWTGPSVNTDFGSAFNTSNGRFTPTVAGYYLINVARRHGYSGLSESNQHGIGIYKNGTNYGEPAIEQQGSGGYPIFWLSKIVPMNGTTDYCSIYLYDDASQSNVGGVFEAMLIRETS